jgi:hypothetical protein
MIQCGPYVKIGTTSDIDKRLRKLIPDNPYPVKLVGLWRGEGGREEEWHSALKHLHHQGEWYKIGNAGTYE